MTCADCREALSARLDDEGLPEEQAEVDAHLAGCPDCRRYGERAAQVTRLARTSLVEPVPDLIAAVRHAVPGPPARVRWESALRVLLAGIGVGQLGLATSDVLAAAGGHHGGDAMSGASLTHFSHESSAWNLALAVGFLCVAARPTRTRGMVPLVGAFVGVLTALSAVDLVLHRVEGSRLLSHALVVVGLFALLGLARVVAHRPTGAPDVLGEPVPAGLLGGADRVGDVVRHGPSRSDGDQDLKPSARRHAA
jgi:predicted anti-sigma-YlaC factor YlaD